MRYPDPARDVAATEPVALTSSGVRDPDRTNTQSFSPLATGLRVVRSSAAYAVLLPSESCISPCELRLGSNNLNIYHCPIYLFGS